MRRGGCYRRMETRMRPFHKWIWQGVPPRAPVCPRLNGNINWMWIYMRRAPYAASVGSAGLTAGALKIALRGEKS